MSCQCRSEYLRRDGLIVRGSEGGLGPGMFLGMFNLWRGRVLGRGGGWSCQGIECQLGGELV